MIQRRAMVSGALATTALGWDWALAADGPPAGSAAAGAGVKTLRVSFPTAETGFDPAQTSDVYSRAVIAHILEAPYRYDHLARPVKVRPNTAAALPEVSADFKVWTIRLRPGIFFQDDPAFGGRPRELTAADYVYAIKRFVDPSYKSSSATEVLEHGFIGLAERRREALDGKKPFDYDAPVEGLQALDRYTLQLRLQAPRPRLLEVMANNGQMGAVAREVVERYRDDIMAHPVGTGPFRLVSWRRGSRMVLERNPAYRERLYDEEPAAADAAGQAILARLKGRRIPMVDRVEISVIEESQPNWLAFLNGELDQISVPGEFVTRAAPGGKLAPNLAKRGLQLTRTLNADNVFFFLNMEDPLVGGMEAPQVALRRAISLAINVPRLIDKLYRGQGIPAQSPIPPNVSGYDPGFKSEMGDHDPARARALLEIYGWRDQNGDGFRETRDGQPLVLTMATQTDQFSRGFDEMMQKDLAAVGIRVRLVANQWSENLKAARAGRLQMWMLGGNAVSPDGLDFVTRYFSPQAGMANFARFKLPSFDRVYEQLQRLPDGPERLALFREAKLMAITYMPYKSLLHRIANDLTWPQLVGYRRPLFWRDWYQFVDLQPVERT